MRSRYNGFISLGTIRLFYIITLMIGAEFLHPLTSKYHLWNVLVFIQGVTKGNPLISEQHTVCVLYTVCQNILWVALVECLNRLETIDHVYYTKKVFWIKVCISKYFRDISSWSFWGISLRILQWPFFDISQTLLLPLNYGIVMSDLQIEIQRKKTLCENSRQIS